MTLESWLLTWTFWHWGLLGVILLLLEVLGTAGLLLWTGIAALITGVLTWLLPLNLTTQWCLFAVLSAITTWIWHRLNRRSHQTETETYLNQRMSRCIGQQTQLIDAIVQGRGRVRLDDTYWTVRADEDLPKGTLVRIIAAEGTILVVTAMAATDAH
jgi:membrane protein implicated in regulation of membrane protease activity